MINKLFTNATFTKRVDHDAGRHRPALAPAEPLVCNTCGARYEHRRWTAKTDVPPARAFDPLRAAALVTCPACRQKENSTPCGYVSISGAFYARHRDDIERLVRNEAERAGHDNPLAQIISVDGGRSYLEVTTTTEHLAQRLGHALAKAYDGEMCYDFSHENKLARVRWRRD